MQNVSTHLSLTEQALLLASFFRGNPPSQTHWTSSCDQVIALSLFYTGDMSYADCEKRFETGYVSPLYDSDGELLRDLRDRYNELIELIRRRPDLISGGGNFDRPADPTYTACKLTQEGFRLIPDLINLFPAKPTFANWPDKNELTPT
jgi:hypothetical protein